MAHTVSRSTVPLSNRPPTAKTLSGILPPTLVRTHSPPPVSDEYQDQGLGPDIEHGTVAVDEFASKEGLPAAADPELNNVVNDEINKL